MDILTFPASESPFLEPYLPQPLNPSPPSTNTNPDTREKDPSLPFTTLTFATSLDSSLSLSPGTRTILSGPKSKAMTHYLRSRHAGILIGVGTAVADNPGLNCRIGGVGGYGGEELQGQPRPIVLDPNCRWEFDEGAKILELVRAGKGRAPWVFVREGVEVDERKRGLLERFGGRFIFLDGKGEGGF
ncbi:dihydrofolate reductase-like domain-containing protein, partial [Aspergillus karnatakaensis]|uniref:RibD family protein n=1 Tax=Aspergillus karnatakaensis TaxID=1810916 RepID=UPI003CCCA18E